MLKYEEDLFPGDCFAESALDGFRSRLTTVQAMTGCDLAVLERQDYAKAAIENYQKESVDDKFQFLSRTTLFRHWEGVEIYRVASVMVREDYTKGAVLIRKGDISKRLCFLVEGRIDVVLGLNHVQVQSVITSVKQNECFNESGILTYMALQNTSGPMDRSESFAETCDAICGSHVTLLCLPENHYSIIDQTTLCRLLTAFREKNHWRIGRADTLREESRNITMWKKKIQQERQREEMTWVPPPRQKTTMKEVHIESLDDIPSLLDPDVDPVLAISTCKMKRDVNVFQQAVRESHRPKSARVASVRKYLAGASPLIKYGGPKRVAYAIPENRVVTAPLESRSYSEFDKIESPNALPAIEPKIPFSPVVSPPVTQESSNVQMLRSPSRHLVGSANIPSTRSYCDTFDSGRFVVDAFLERKK